MPMPYMYTLFYEKIHHIFGRFQGKPPKTTSNDKLQKFIFDPLKCHWSTCKTSTSFCNMYQIQFCHMFFFQWQVSCITSIKFCHMVLLANAVTADILLRTYQMQTVCWLIWPHSRHLNHNHQICDLWYCNSSWLTFSTQSSFHDKYQRTKYRNTLTKASAK